MSIAASIKISFALVCPLATNCLIPLHRTISVFFSYPASFLPRLLSSSASSSVSTTIQGSVLRFHYTCAFFMPLPSWFELIDAFQMTLNQWRLKTLRYLRPQGGCCRSRVVPLSLNRALFIRKGGERSSSDRAELIHAIVLFFWRLGITSSDVGIKVSSRKVLQAMLRRHSVPESLFAEVCVIVDKKLRKELISAGVSFEAVNGIIGVLSNKSISQLKGHLGGVTSQLKLSMLLTFIGSKKIPASPWDSSILVEGQITEAICGGGDLMYFSSDDVGCGLA
ncbi:hypothetical protein HPP92_006935 [Vanilla planifolia]|uniref:histidine--tRNA ligase n=1 Tax=Vanilla planifolia TaxID=51239 RepID=A0A835V8F8_VANPL|nr:hypothetical protein HPP92_007174 [Vanilla planifolia]KAG0490072.1 hypothetical protein HPP92_006935 [Vanilla planifolia]